MPAAQDEEHRVEEDEAETRVKLKAMREHHKNWEATREKRIGTWRDFSKKKSKKQKVGAALCTAPPGMPPASRMIPDLLHMPDPLRAAFNDSWCASLVNASVCAWA